MVLGLGACGPGSAGRPACADGPRAPGVRATLSAESDFTASDVNNLTRRFYTAGAACVVVGAPGARTLEVSEQGLTGARVSRLMRPGILRFATWGKPATAGSTGGPRVVALDPRQVAVTDGGTCAISTPTLACAPQGYVALESGVDGSGVTMVTAARDANSGQVLRIALSDTARARLARVTERMPAEVAPLNQLALVLDDVLVSNANIQSPLNNGTVDVSGPTDDPTRYADLATLINTGRVTPYTISSQSNL